MKASVTKSLAIGAIAAAATNAMALTYPPTEKKPVSDTFFGTTVTEDYRWLENGKDPAVKAWGEAQMKLTRATIDALAIRPALEKRLKELYSTSPVRYYDMQQRGLFFAMKRQPPKNQPFLVVMKAAGDRKSERVLIDPNTLDKGGTTAIDWYVPSLDGKYVAVSLSKNGSEDGSAHVIDVATGKEQGDVVPRVQWPTGGGSLAWDAKGTGFFYTRYPQGKERAPGDMNFYQQVYFHKLGAAPSTDTYVIGKDFPRIAETRLDSTRDGKYILASVANGDGGEFAYYLRDESGKWTRVADYADKIRGIEMGFDGNLYALSLKDAPRGKVLSISMAKPELASARVVVAESEATIEDIAPTAKYLYVGYMVGGPSEIRIFDLAGKPVRTLPTEAVSSNTLGERLGGDDILVRSESFLTSAAWYRYSPGSNKLAKTDLADPSKVSFADAEVKREMAKSKDGTMVPVNIIMKKGTKLDGSNPLLLYGYGGYGLSERPHFSLWARVWLDHGGVFATVNLRGGGEYGEAWHLAGNLTNKQHVFDDMIGAAEHVIARGYTKPEQPLRRGRQQRRTAHGRHPHAAPGPLPRGVERGRHLRHAARGAHAQRRVQRHRVRHREGRGAIQGALRLLAVSSREGRDRLSGDPLFHRGERWPRRSVQLAQDGRAPAGRRPEGPPDPAAHQRRHGARHRHQPRQARRGRRRRPRLPHDRAGNEMR